MARAPLKIYPLHNLVELQTLRRSDLVIPGAHAMEALFFLFFSKKSEIPANFSEVLPGAANRRSHRRERKKCYFLCARNCVIGEDHAKIRTEEYREMGCGSEGIMGARRRRRRRNTR